MKVHEHGKENNLHCQYTALFDFCQEDFAVDCEILRRYNYDRKCNKKAYRRK